MSSHHPQPWVLLGFMIFEWDSETWEVKFFFFGLVRGENGYDWVQFKVRTSPFPDLKACGFQDKHPSLSCLTRKLTSKMPLTSVRTIDSKVPMKMITIMWCRTYHVNTKTTLWQKKRLENEICVQSPGSYGNKINSQVSGCGTFPVQVGRLYYFLHNRKLIC